MIGRLNSSLVLLLTAVVLVGGAYLVLSESYILSALVLAGIYAIIITGLVLLTGLCGQYSLGHAAFFATGSYGAAILTTHWMPPLAAAAVAVGLTTAIAVLISIPLLRLRGYYLAVATLAFGLIAYSILKGWRSLTFGPSGIPDIPPFSVGPFVIKGDQSNYWFVWAIALVGVWVAINLWRSRAGQALLAVKHDEIAAAALGINVHVAKVQIFALSAAYASVGGVLYAHYVSFIAPERFTMMTSFELLIAALLGGLGTPFGALIGALLLVAMPELLAPLRDFKTIVYGLVFILVSLYFPRGVAGMLQGLPALLRRSPENKAAYPGAAGPSQ
jgi:branched-chain amino acid transport system permease protein